MVKDVAISAREFMGSISTPVKSDAVLPTSRHRSDVFSELCWPSAKPRG